MNATTGLKAAARKFGPTKRYKTTKIDEELELALHEKWEYTLFSVQPLCTLCLCGSLLLGKNNHRDTEYTEVAQRIETFRAKPLEPYFYLLVAGTSLRLL